VNDLKVDEKQEPLLLNPFIFLKLLLLNDTKNG